MKVTAKIKILLLVLSVCILFCACSQESETSSSAASSSGPGSPEESSGESSISCSAASVESSRTTSSAVEHSSPASSSEKDKIIGTVSLSISVRVVDVTNETGKNIDGFFVKNEETEDYSSNMMPASEIFKIGEKRKVYFDPNKNTAAEESSSEDTEVESYPSYTVKLTFTDDTETELHGFPFDDGEDIVIKTNGVVMYVDYTQTSSGVKRSTMEDEQALYDASLAEEYTEETQEVYYEEPSQDTSSQTIESSSEAEPLPEESSETSADPNEGCTGENEVETWPEESSETAADPNEGCTGGNEVETWPEESVEESSDPNEGCTDGNEVETW